MVRGAAPEGSGIAAAWLALIQYSTRIALPLNLESIMQERLTHETLCLSSTRSRGSNLSVEGQLAFFDKIQTLLLRNEFTMKSGISPFSLS